jgi:small-conductance mechanosensitive channel
MYAQLLDYLHKFQIMAADPNQADLERMVEHHLQSLLTLITGWLNLSPAFAPIIEWALRVLGVLLVLLLIILLARRSRLRKMVDWFDDRIGFIQLSPMERNILAFMAWFIIWLPGVLLILYILKLHVLLATVGISAGAIATITALSNRELMGNIFAGLNLQARGHVAPGDAIKVMGLTGTLQSVGLSSCIIEDFDGAIHYIPNAKFLNEVLTNFSQAEVRREEISFWVDNDEVDMDEVEALIKQIIQEAPGQKIGKEGFFRYGDYTERGQELKLYIFFDTKQNWRDNSSAVRRMLIDKIAASNIKVGIPQQLVLFLQDSENKPTPNS